MLQKVSGDLLLHTFQALTAENPVSASQMRFELILRKLELLAFGTGTCLPNRVGRAGAGRRAQPLGVGGSGARRTARKSGRSGRTKMKRSEAVGAASVAVPLAAAGGLAEAEPAGGAIAGAEEAVGVDERLEEDRLVVVAGAPVGGEAAGGVPSQVAELGAAVETEAEIVPADDEFAPEGDLGACGHRAQGDGSQVAAGAGDAGLAG